MDRWTVAVVMDDQNETSLATQCIHWTLKKLTAMIAYFDKRYAVEVVDA